jgi:hypothetical protein
VPRCISEEISTGSQRRGHLASYPACTLTKLAENALRELERLKQLYNNGQEPQRDADLRGGRPIAALFPFLLPCDAAARRHKTHDKPVGTISVCSKKIKAARRCPARQLRAGCCGGSNTEARRRQAKAAMPALAAYQAHALNDPFQLKSGLPMAIALAIVLAAAHPAQFDFATQTDTRSSRRGQRMGNRLRRSTGHHRHPARSRLFRRLSRRGFK